jgi:hypothetical protein
MLSRSVIINRTPGESSKTAGMRLVDEQVKRDAHLKGRLWGSMILLAALLVALAAFLLLNRGAVVEPRVRLLIVNHERPELLPVLLFTSLLSVACTVAARSVSHARRQLEDSRGRSLTSAIELEASRIKHAAISRPAALP